MYPQGKLQVMSQIRSVVRDTDYMDGRIEDQREIVVAYIKKFKKKYETTPELIAFLIQKFNAFYLNAAMTASGTDSIPFVEYLDVESIADELGYPKLYTTLAHNLVRRSEGEKYSSYRIGMNRSGRQRKSASANFKHEGVHTMLKAASKSATLLGVAISDPNLKYKVKELVDKTESAFNKASSLFYGVNGLEASVLKAHWVRGNRKIASIIDVFKFNAPLHVSMTKTASATVAVLEEFKTILTKYAELKEELDEVEQLTPEMVSDLNRKDKKELIEGTVIMTTAPLRGGFGAFPASTELEIVAVNGENVHVVRNNVGEDEEDLEYTVPKAKLEKAGFMRAE